MAHLFQIWLKFFQSLKNFMSIYHNAAIMMSRIEERMRNVHAAWRNKPIRNSMKYFKTLVAGQEVVDEVQVNQDSIFNLILNQNFQ